MVEARVIRPSCGSLFSSVGGMDIGLSRAGFQHAFFCEQDEWRRTILARHWPGVPIHHDVRDVHGGVAEAVDLLAGGFPCQDLSVAGRRAGLIDGARSSLFFEFARVADALVRPGGWVLIENVPGLLSSQSGRDFGVVLSTLADIGFMDGAWRVLDARFFGVPQRRRRVFILARRAPSGDRARAVLLEPEGGRRDLAPRYETRACTATGAGGSPKIAGSLSRRYGKGVNTTVDDGSVVVNRMLSTNHGGWRIGAEEAAGGALQVVAALDRRRGGADENEASGGQLIVSSLTKGSVDKYDDNSAQGNHLVPVAFHMTQDSISGSVSPAMGKGNSTGAATIAAHTAQGVRRLTPTECERLMGWPDGWTEPGSDSRRYAACGDGVVSYVAEWIGRRLRDEMDAI